MQTKVRLIGALRVSVVLKLENNQVISIFSLSNDNVKALECAEFIGGYLG